MRAAILIAAFTAVLLLAGRYPSMWNDDLGAISPLSTALTEGDGRFREALGLPEVRFVIAARAPTREAALMLAERIEPALRALVDDGTISGFQSPAALLPSESVQRRRQKALAAIR